MTALIAEGPTAPTDDVGPAILRDGDLVIFADARIVTLAGHVVRIRPREFDLLLYLFKRRGKVVGRPELLTQVWRSLDFNPKVIDWQMCQLRQHIGADRIVTVERNGFRFDPKGPEETKE